VADDRWRLKGTGQPFGVVFENEPQHQVEQQPEPSDQYGNSPHHSNQGGVDVEVASYTGGDSADLLVDGVLVERVAAP